MIKSSPFQSYYMRCLLPFISLYVIALSMTDLTMLTSPFCKSNPFIFEPKMQLSNKSNFRTALSELGLERKTDVRKEFCRRGVFLRDCGGCFCGLVLLRVRRPVHSSSSKVRVSANSLDSFRRDNVLLLRFVKGAMNVVDLLGILPYFMSLILSLVTVSRGRCRS